MIAKIDGVLPQTPALEAPQWLDAAGLPALPASQGATQAAGSDFASVLAGMANDAVTSLKGAEAMSFKAIEGKANTREVVDAVLSAQQTLQTALAVRDKVVSAYLEISKMQI